MLLQKCCHSFELGLNLEVSVDLVLELCYYLENVGHVSIMVAYFEVLGCGFYDLWAEDLSIDFETSTHGCLICSSKPSPHFHFSSMDL